MHGVALDNILRIVDEALPDIMNQIQTNMPKILELGGKILTTLSDGIIEYLPQILDTVIIIIDKVSEAIMQNSDKFSEISGKLMSISAQGMVNAIPHVLMAIGRVIWALLLELTKANDKLWQQGFEFLVNLIRGIQAKLGQLQTIAESIKLVIKRAIDSLISSAFSWGIDMVTGFGNGIMSALGSLKQRASEMANSIRSYLHFSKPDVGPLRDYETWLPDMVKGMVISLDKAMPIMNKELDKFSSDMAMKLSPTLNGSVNSNLSPMVNVVVNNSLETDPLGQVVSRIKTFSNGAKNDYNYGYGG